MFKWLNTIWKTVTDDRSVIAFFRRASVIAVLAIVIFGSAGFGYAADYYWVAAVDGGLTSDAANWKKNSAGACGDPGGFTPGSADIAHFASACTNDATIDAAMDVSGLDIESGYTGTITQGSGVTITVGSSNWVQDDGTFVGSDRDILVNKTFTLDGTFIQNDSPLSVSSGFTLNSGATFTKSPTNGVLLTFFDDLPFTDNTASLQDLGQLYIGGGTTTLQTDLKATSILMDRSMTTDGYEITTSGDITFNSSLDVTNGTGGNTTIKVGGNWAAQGTFTSINSTVMFTGTTAGLTITSNGNPVNNVIINDGLVLYYKFDESSSPSRDSSGYGYDAAWVNTPTTTTSVSATGKFYSPRAIVLNGTDEYLENTTFKWPVDENDPVGGPVTVAFWNYVASADVQDSYAFVVEGGDNFLVQGPWGSGEVNWYYGSGGAYADYANYFDKWTHVVVISDGTGGADADVYLDGVSVGLGVVVDGPDVQLTGIQVGHRDAAEYHKGRMDDFRIYNRVLSTTEIQALATGYQPGTGLGTYTLQDDLIVEGTLTINSGELDANSNDIYVGRGWMNHGGIFTTINRNVIFNGSASDALILAGSQTFSDIQITGSGVWTLQDDVPVSSLFNVSAGTLTYATSTVIAPISINGNTEVSGGTFTGQSARFRHDGNLTITSGAYTVPTSGVEIGGSFEHSGGSFTISGSTVMFTGTDTHTINTSGGTAFQDVIINDGLVGYWKLDETATNAVAKDSSGYGNHGTAANFGAGGAATVSNRIKFNDPRSLLFDAANDVITIPDNDILDGLGPLTYSAWIRPTSLGEGNTGVIIGKAGSTSIYRPHFQMVSSNRLRFRYDGATVLRKVSANNQYTLGQWIHVAATWDGGTAHANIHMYVNGVEVTYGVNQDGVSLNNGDALNYYIGNNGEGTETFGGYIDDVRIYNRVLSVAEIQRLANGKNTNTGLGTYTLQTNLNVDGTLRINTGTLSAGANRQINLGGDWENFGGIFVEQSGTVILDGTSQQIPASETFYNFTKTLGAAPSRTLTFGQNSTVTISNTLTMNGFDSAAKLSLRSSSVGAKFNVNVPGGVQTVNYLDVKDSKASSNNIRAHNSTNSGNTDAFESAPHWIFGPLRGAVMSVE